MCYLLIFSLRHPRRQALTARPPWAELLLGETDAAAAAKRVLQAMESGERPEPPPSASAELRAFLARCFEPSPAARASAGELAGHPWLAAA